MTTADQAATLAGALAAVQAQLPHVHKGETAVVKSDKGNYRYTYADLADVTAAILPLLGKNGLAWTTAPTVEDGAFVLRYRLMHAAGAELSGSYPLPDPGRASPQQLGSAISYARRYALCSVTGVAPDDDDDAAAATAGHQPQQQHEQAPAEQAGPTAAQIRDELLADPWAGSEQLQAIYRRAYQAGRLAEVVTDDTGEQVALGDLIKARGREAKQREAQADDTTAEPGTDPGAAPADQKSDEQRRRERMHALFGECGYKDRTDRLALCSMVVGRDIDSTTQLKWPTEVEKVISALESQQNTPTGPVTPEVAKQKREQLEGTPA